jgi:hypothetical protein
MSQVGGALIDRNPVDHITTAIIANPPPGDWQVVTPPGQPPLASVEVAKGQHLPDNTFHADLAPTGKSLDGIQASARAHSAPLTRARIAALGALPPIERARLITTQVTVPAGLGGSLQFLDVGPTATRPIENVSLTTVAGGVDTSSRKITLAFAPTDDPGQHQIQVIKYQQGIGAAGSLPQRSFVVGGFVVPPTPRPTAPHLTVHRDSAGRVLVDVTPGSAGPLAGDPSATFDLIANTAAGQRIERIIHGYSGRTRVGDVATPLPRGRFRVVLNDIPKTTTVEVFGRMEYANVFGKQSSHKLRCRHC